jgi:hypothetical protein
MRRREFITLLGGAAAADPQMLAMKLLGQTRGMMSRRSDHGLRPLYRAEEDLA